MFNAFDKILKKQELTAEDYKKISSWQMNMWLSGNNVTLPFALLFNQYDEIPLELKVRVLKELLPNIRRINYPKTDKTKDAYIELISKSYKVNKQLARLYYDNFSTDDLIELEAEYSKGGTKK